MNDNVPTMFTPRIYFTIWDVTIFVILNDPNKKSATKSFPKPLDFNIFDLTNITSPPWTFGERFDFLSHCSILHFFHVFLWKNKYIVDRSNTYQSQNSWSNQRCLRDIGTLRYFAMIILFCLGPIGLSNSDAFLVHFAAGSITVDSWLRLKSDHLLVQRC